VRGKEEQSVAVCASNPAFLTRKSPQSEMPTYSSRRWSKIGWRCFSSAIFTALIGAVLRRRSRKRQYCTPTAMGRSTSTRMPLCARKSTKPTPRRCEMTTFGGSPTSVAVPPMVAASVCVR
jgi:hypothetical protein